MIPTGPPRRKPPARKNTRRTSPAEWASLNRKEADVLEKKVRKSQLSREAYLRHLIHGVAPREAPPPDYYAMMRELYRLGNALEQLNKSTPAQEHNAAVLAAETAVREITRAVVLPQPIGK